MEFQEATNVVTTMVGSDYFASPWWRFRVSNFRVFLFRVCEFWIFFRVTLFTLSCRLIAGLLFGIEDQGFRLINLILVLECLEKSKASLELRDQKNGYLGF